MFCWFWGFHVVASKKVRMKMGALKWGDSNNA
jgi:hypothetical protein